MHGKKLDNITFNIKEGSLRAKIAAKKLKAPSAAIVLGTTIYLHNISKEDFLKDTRFFKHELCHVRQYKQYGFWGFIFRYLWETIRNGYRNNKFEIEARQSEEL